MPACACIDVSGLSGSVSAPVSHRASPESVVDEQPGASAYEPAEYGGAHEAAVGSNDERHAAFVAEVPGMNAGRCNLYILAWIAGQL